MTQVDICWTEEESLWTDSSTKTPNKLSNYCASSTSQLTAPSFTTAVGVNPADQSAYAVQDVASPISPALYGHHTALFPASVPNDQPDQLKQPGLDDNQKVDLRQPDPDDQNFSLLQLQLTSLWLSSSLQSRRPGLWTKEKEQKSGQEETQLP